ncbi:MAG: cyclase [Actinobacteria bacterium]|nr:MAG: cyclase [Actinomycetota bacterium]
MVDSGSESVVVLASAEKCYAVATDFEKYPQWAHDIKEVTVLKRDEKDRPTVVEFRASALGRSTHYTLEYDYALSPGKLSWHMSDGDIMRAILGSYTFEPVDNGTRISYDLSVELVVPIPGFVKRRAEMRILSTLKELKSLIES